MDRISALESELIARQKYESSLVELEKDIALAANCEAYGYSDLNDMKTKVGGWMQFIKTAKDLPPAVAEEKTKQLKNVEQILSAQIEMLLNKYHTIIANFNKANTFEELDDAHRDVIAAAKMGFDSSMRERLDECDDNYRALSKAVSTLPENLDELRDMIKKDGESLHRVLINEIQSKIGELVIVEVNIIVIVVLLGIAIALRSHQVEKPSILGTGSYSAADFSIPQYSGSAYVEINDNIPFFEESDITSTPYEEYSSLDRLGRCGPAMACLGRETMPTEERGEIGMIRPSGWHTVRYDDLIEDKYLYNRCHLIAYALAGENDNELNLITGTRYMNIEGMLPFEIEAIDYILDTGNHVLYRVTPCFFENDLVAAGVLMEAYSVEDNGRGLSFNVFVFNVQPGINIDYRTGNSSRQ